MEEHDDDQQEVWYFGESYGQNFDPDSGDYFLECLIGGVAILGILAILVAALASHH